MKRIVFIILSLVLSQHVFSQTITDALRYSRYETGGTARSIGVGGGIGALGADFSVIGTNPAGLAQYRKSEFIFTPSLNFSEVDSKLVGEGNEAFNEAKANFNFSNIGIVIASQPTSSKWNTFNVGIGFNRIANFHQRFFYEGNTTGSITDRFRIQANETGLDQFEADLADQTSAIYILPGEDLYTNDFEDFQGTLVMRNQDVRTTGSINELVFSMAGNLEEKLLMGFTIGIPFISFNENKIYKEQDIDSIPFFNNLTFEEDLNTTGVGINLKLGLIYRINQMVRLGMAIHTPSAFSLTDNFSTSLVYDYTDLPANDGPVEASSPDGTFEYKFKSPWRVIGSAGVLINRSGFVSAEVEWVDYATSSFNLTANSTNEADRRYEQQLNNEIEQAYTSALNFRLGGEYAYDLLRFRAGYNILGIPFVDDSSTNSTFSLGFGIREESFFIDLAYQKSMIDDTYLPYVLPGGGSPQVVRNDVSNNKYLLTIGFKF